MSGYSAKECRIIAENQRKLAVWAKRKRMPTKAAKHEADSDYFLKLAMEKESANVSA